MDGLLHCLVAFCVAIAAYLLFESLRPRPLPGIPVAYPVGYKSIPWFVGFGWPIAKLAKKGDMPMELFWEASQGLEVSQMIVGPAGTWFSRLTGIGQHFVLCADVQELESAFAWRSRVFSRVKGDTDFIAFASPRGMFMMPSGADQQHQRRVFGASMTKIFLANSLPRIEKTFSELVALWRSRVELAQRGGQYLVDVKRSDDLRVASVDVIASVVFGKSLGGLADRLRFIRTVSHPSSASSSPSASGYLASHFTVFEQMQAAFLRSNLIGLSLGRSAEVQTARADTVRFVEERITAERAVRSVHGNLGNEQISASRADHVLGIALDAELADAANGNAPLPHADLVDNLLTFFQGGADTMAATLSWTIKLLSRRPDVQARIRDELANQCPNGLVFEALRDEACLPYLHAVTWECLRLARPIGLSFRTTTSDTVLLGHPVPKGTTVGFLIGHMGAAVGHGTSKEHSELLTREGKRDGKSSVRKVGWWEQDDVGAFRPERWLKRGEDGVEAFDRAAGPVAIFGAGPRGCLGKPLAFLELQVAIAKLVDAFSFDAVPSELDTDDFKTDLSRWPTEVNLNLRPRPVGSRTGS